MAKRVVFLDMDGVLADFDNEIAPENKQLPEDPPEMFVPGFFRRLKVMPGAKESVKILTDCPDLDVYVGSKPTTKMTSSATEKYDWVEEHFPQLLRKIVLVCNKALLRGDVLVDDDAKKWGNVFVGQFIHFDHDRPEESWARVLNQLGLGYQMPKG